MLAQTIFDGGLRRATVQQFEAVYEQYFGLLVQIASFKFRVPDSEAETLVHDVLYRQLELKLHGEHGA